MNSDRFKELLEELDGNSVKTLAEKNARYSQNGDALHNFRSGAEIAGGTPAQACWGYMTKHLVALRDMVEKNDFSNREDFLEKCQDTINYIRFLWCIGNDRFEKPESVVNENDDDRGELAQIEVYEIDGNGDRRVAIYTVDDGSLNQCIDDDSYFTAPDGIRYTWDRYYYKYLTQSNGGYSVYFVVGPDKRS